ncbi:MAG TPA: hypothetical protein VHD63_01200 [Ktedonobacteraceae bacterium]|nr:hypothetical protein [Ktedonobacteraceae bacterium]
MTIEEILLSIAHPDIYRLNIFRITELPVDAEARDLSRRQATIKQARDIGVAIPPGYGRVLPLSEAVDEDLLSATFQHFEDPVRRLTDELFWFWPRPSETGRSDENLQALGRGEIDGVYQRWRQMSAAPDDQGTALHNLAILRHVQALNSEQAVLEGTLAGEEQHLLNSRWLEAYSYWKALLDNEAFWSRVTTRIRELDDPRLTTGMVVRFRARLPETLLTINARLAVAAAERGHVADSRRHLDLLRASGFAQTLQDDVLHRAIEPLQERVKTLTKLANEQSAADPRRGNSLANQLLEQAKPLLAVVDTLLPAGDVTRAGIHDEVAEWALTVEIRYGNKTDDWKTFMPLVDRLEPLQPGELVRTRIIKERAAVKSLMESLLCWYCKDRYAEKGATNNVKMYGNVRRYSVGYNTRRTEWQTLSVPVARCRECQQAQDKAHGLSSAGAWLGALLAVVLAIIITVQLVANVPPTQKFDYATDTYTPAPGDPSGMICLGVFIGIALLIVIAVIGSSIGTAIGSSQYLKPINTRKASDVKTHPLVAQQLAKGWKIGSRPST